jgi:hypothetical protein
MIKAQRTSLCLHILYEVLPINISGDHRQFQEYLITAERVLCPPPGKKTSEMNVMSEL